MSFTPAVSLSPASGYFLSETLNAAVTVRGCDRAAYTLKIGSSTITGAAAAGDVITIEGLTSGERATLSLTGYDAENRVLATVTRRYTRWVKLDNTVVYMDPAARSGWNQCYIYVWGSAENAGWPGVKMERTGDGLYRYVMPYPYELPGAYGNVIFNNGSSQQFDAGRITPGQKMIYTAAGEWLPYEEPVTRLLGDADTSGEVTILDATVIQRRLAALSVTAFDEQAADTDGIGGVTILDATHIQRWLAALSAPAGIGQPIA